LVFGITDIPCIGTLKKIEMDPYINTMDKDHTDLTNMCIGTHIQKQKCFIKSLEAFFSKANLGRPVQIFSGSPKFWRRPSVTNAQQQQVKNYIASQSPALEVFVHSIYLINLCWDPEKFAEKALPCIQWELRNGAAMGFKGVVIHCGKQCKMTREKAAENMLINIRLAMEAASPECPLLLETSAGQGSEMYWDFEGFRNFYTNFSDEEKTRLRICIDTCHVFAAGHDPMKFIADWEDAHSGSLVLVHFNDSKDCCGSKKDRHERPGQGKIGLSKMAQVAKWCMERKIPMVME